MLSPACDMFPPRRPPGRLAKFETLAHLGNRVAKPLGIVTLAVGVGVLVCLAGRWSARPRTPSARVPVVAPMQNQDALVSSDVLSRTAHAVSTKKSVPQQAMDAPTSTIPQATDASTATTAPAGKPAQRPQAAMQPSTPPVHQNDATPRVRTSEPRRPDSLIYAVHVSSFRMAAGAAAEVVRLQARGYQARAVRTDLGSKGIWFRVYVGQYATSAEASQARTEILQRTEYSSAHVRPIVLL